MLPRAGMFALCCSASSTRMWRTCIAAALGQARCMQRRRAAERWPPAAPARALIHMLPLLLRCWAGGLAQDKKKAEEARKKELADLFAMAIKQPKVPVGEWRTRRRRC